MNIPPIEGKPAFELVYDGGANKSSAKLFFSGLVNSIFGSGLSDVSGINNAFIEQSKRAFCAARIEDSNIVGDSPTKVASAVRTVDDFKANNAKESVSDDRKARFKEIFMHRRIAEKEAKEAILGAKDDVERCENLFRHLGNCGIAEVYKILQKLPMQQVLVPLDFQNIKPELLENVESWNKLMMFVIYKERKLYDQEGGQALESNLTGDMLRGMRLYAPVQVQYKFLNSLNPDKIKFLMAALRYSNNAGYFSLRTNFLSSGSYEFIEHIYLMSLITSNRGVKQKLEEDYPNATAFMKMPDSEKDQAAGPSLIILKRMIQLEKATEQSVINELKLALKRYEKYPFYKICESFRKDPKFLSLLD